MFIKETFVGVQCDNCTELAENFDGAAFFADEETARDNAVNGEEWHEHEGKHYCDRCVSFNDDDQIILDASRIPEAG